MAQNGQDTRKGVGTVSELAGVFIGTAASTGKKIIVGGGKGIAGIGKTILSVGRRSKVKVPSETTKVAEQSEVEESKVSLPESEFFSLESAPQHNADTETRAKELEFELSDAQKELNQARHKAVEAQSHLASQLNILQREMMSPLSNLKNIQSGRPPNPALRHNADTEARARKLESELAEKQEAHSHLMSQLNAMKKERASIIEDLGDARDEADNAENRIRAIESELDEAQLRLEKIREQPDETASPHESSVFLEVTSDDVCNALFAIESEREIVQRSLSDITNGNEETRSEAAEALGSVRHDLAIRGLANRLTQEPSAQVRAECVGALMNIGMKEGLPAVERALTDQDACVRLAAVKGVYRLAGTESIPMLVSALSDENDNVRYRAGVLTGWLGRDDLAVKMRKLLNQNLLQGSTHGRGQQVKEGMEDAI